MKKLMLLVLSLVMLFSFVSLASAQVVALQYFYYYDGTTLQVPIGSNYANYAYSGLGFRNANKIFGVIQQKDEFNPVTGQWDYSWEYARVTPKQDVNWYGLKISDFGVYWNGTLPTVSGTDDPLWSDGSFRATGDWRWNSLLNDGQTTFWANSLQGPVTWNQVRFSTFTDMSNYASYGWQQSGLSWYNTGYFASGPEPIPEPGTLILLGSGLLGLAAAHQIRRRKK